MAWPHGGHKIGPLTLRSRYRAHFAAPDGNGIRYADKQCKVGRWLLQNTMAIAGAMVRPLRGLAGWSLCEPAVEGAGTGLVDGPGAPF
jgi:hypothetical protein